MNYFIHSLKNTFNYKGRARRMELGVFVLCNFAIGFGLGFISGFSEELGYTHFAYGIDTILNVINFIFAVSSISLITRRLHDLGYSGWWQLLLIALSFALLFFWVIYCVSDNDFSILEIIISVVIFYAPLLYLIFKDGQKHANKYGKSPKYSTQINTSLEIERNTDE